MQPIRCLVSRHTMKGKYMDRRSFIGGIPGVGGAALKATVAAPRETACAKFLIEGFSCVTCATGLDVMLRQLRGVTRASANYPGKSVVIGFDGNLTSIHKLK